MTTADVLDYLGELAHCGRADGARWRKLAAVRECVRYAKQVTAIAEDSAEGIDTPKAEERGRNWLTTTESTKVLAAAGGNVGDFCLLTVMLQTGVRISELCALTLDDIDLEHHVLQVRAGKGMKARTIPLEMQASAACRAGARAGPPALTRRSS